MNDNIKELNLAILGLGYVGLPLALAFAKKRKVIGFDTNNLRIKELIKGKDKNLEFTKKELQEATKLSFTNDPNDLKLSNCFIITVPTPIDKMKKPDLSALKKASMTVGGMLKKKILLFMSQLFIQDA